MRKIIFSAILIASSFFGFAQFNTVQFSPVTFTGEDSVTLTIDLTGTSLAGETELYIWIWANKEGGTGFPEINNAPTNSDWGNSPPIAKFTSLGNNRWSYAFSGTNMFGLTPGQLKHFQFLVKTKTGNKQTADSPKFPFAPIVYVPKLYRLFPELMEQDDAITLYFDQRLATTITENRMTPLTVTVTLYNGSLVFDAPKTFQMTTIGDKLSVSETFIPSYEWNIPDGTTLTRFTYVVNGTTFDQNGATINVTGAINTKVFDILQ